MNDLLLGVNIDHVATLRQARGTRYPDPVHAALQVEQAGADSITLHLREDRRHIQDRDVYLLKERMLTRMNLEMAVTNEMVAIACDVKPEDCCLVPEKREELTTEGGLDVLRYETEVTNACEKLAAAGIKVSLFIDADLQQIDAAKRSGASVIEIHTGHYADAENLRKQQRLLNEIIIACEHAQSIGLQVNAGHGLNRQNIHNIAGLMPIKELNIGHAIIADSVFMGLEKTIIEYKKLMQDARC
ncbi:Pyridoxine 5'-phosphate synthase [hydrothermal vent metagenome]|uniref:Pyridoxine 5'-phosphate synthase n=1 Tax=hydrothermal vent metagenome TaxID=652676 RepID=A0A3B0WNR3_9ZZZZ